MKILKKLPSIFIMCFVCLLTLTEKGAAQESILCEDTFWAAATETDVVLELESSQVDVNTKICDEETGYTPLYIALLYGTDYAAIMALITRGQASLFIENENGENPVAFAELIYLDAQRTLEQAEEALLANMASDLQAKMQSGMPEFQSRREQQVEDMIGRYFQKRLLPIYVFCA